MTEIILGIIIILLIGVQTWSFYRYQEQEKRFIKAILSRNVDEFTRSEMAEKPKKPEKQVDEYIPVSNLDDEEWEKAIKEESVDAKE